MSKKLKNLGVAVALGAAAGYLASLFVSDKTKKKHKGLVEKSAKELSAFLKDPDKDKRLKELFPDNLKQAEKIYQDTRDRVTKSLNNLSSSLGEVDKQKYQKLVSQAIKEISSKHQLSSKKISMLRKYLEADFQLINKKS